MDLVGLIAQQLGLTQEQAQGGLGVIFRMVQEELDAADFAQVKQAIPNIQAMLDTAPKAAADGGLAGALGGIAKSLGLDNLEGLGKLAAVAEGFKKLGIDPKLVLQFVPKILEWVQKNGGPQLKVILEKVLKP